MIALRTSPEVREAMERLGWHRTHRTMFEEWRSRGEDNCITLWTDAPPTVHGSWEALAPAMAILGIIPEIPGYRVIPEDVAAAIHDKLDTELYLLPKDAPFARQHITWMKEALSTTPQDHQERHEEPQ